MIRRGVAFVVQWMLWILVTVTIVEYRPLWDHHVHGWGRECLAFVVWVVLAGIAYGIGGLIRGSDAPKRTDVTP